MGEKYLKFIKTFTLAALVAGVFFFSSAFSAGGYPKGTSVDGLDVSGMSEACAERALRARLKEELSSKSLAIEADGRKYVFRYPEINVKTDLLSVLKRAKKGGAHALSKRYFLNKEEQTLRGICDDFYCKSKDARVIFCPDEADPFAFEADRCGRYLDGAALKKAVDASLAGSFSKVRVRSVRVTAGVTLSAARELATLRASFTTYFNSDAASRSHNIRLAAEKLNGTVIGGGEAFSFNERVGERTLQNGFREAPIILEGDFVAGVGGGVCQVSTTVYNAALLAGMKITEFHPHSLAVGYVEPSFDAMVSGKNCDLKFENPEKTEAYLICRVRGNALNVKIYSKKSAFTYSRESRTTGSIEPPEAKVIETEEDKTDRAARSGLTSEGYLLRYRNGVLVSRIRLRRDRYAPTRGIVYKKPENFEKTNKSAEIVA